MTSRQSRAAAGNGFVRSGAVGSCPGSRADSRAHAAQTTRDDLGEQDIYLFREGTHARLYNELGCQLDGDEATVSRLGAERTRVAVIGDWNGWNGAAHPLDPRATAPASGKATCAGVQRGAAYKYRIVAQRRRSRSTRPIRSRFYAEEPPRDRVARVDARLRVGRRRMDGDARARAMRSMRRCRSTRCTSARGGATSDGALLGYRDIAEPLADYVQRAWASRTSS